MPKVSVILTSYNKPSYLNRAIKSVLSQTYSDYELIIADDNSPNNEVELIIQQYLNNEKVKYFNSNVSQQDREKTTRYATQINTAVRNYSTGKYLCYLADDDYYYPHMLEKMINYAEKSGVHVCFCAQHIVDVNGNIDGGGIDGRGVRFFKEILDRGADKLDHNQVMTTRLSFDVVDGWNDEPWCWSGADASFYDRLEKAGFKFHPIDYDIPLQAKTYRENSVQWNITNGLSPSQEG